MEISSKNPKFSDTCNGTDRISSLPDDVIHTILSSISTFDVVKLSVLSKRWNYIWTTMPYLNFDLEPRYRPVLEKFRQFIYWVFGSRSATNLVSFKLFSGFMFDNVTILRWIRIATRRNVQELVLSFQLRDPFELPCCLATCESLRALRLYLTDGILKLPNRCEFRQLRLLHLERVWLVDEHLISCFFSKCPLLENLILSDCSLGTTTVLNIASTSLIYVTIESDNVDVRGYSNCKFKIRCPNLKCFKYKAPMAKDIIFENLFSIESVRIFFFDVSSVEEIGVLVHKMIRGIPSTSILNLCMTSVAGLYTVAHDRRLSPFSFYMLKSLKLIVGIDDMYMQVMILLLKHSPNLEVLKMWSDENDGWSENWKMHDPDETIVCLESHLKSIKMTYFKADENEIELLRFFLKNARVLEKLMIFWADDDDKSEEAVEEVLKFPRASSNVTVTFFDAKPCRRYRPFPLNFEKITRLGRGFEC